MEARGEVHDPSPPNGDAAIQAAKTIPTKSEATLVVHAELSTSTASKGDAPQQAAKSVAPKLEVVRARGGERRVNLRAVGDMPDPVIDTDYEMVEQDHEVVGLDPDNVERDFKLVEKRERSERELPEKEQATGEDWVQIHKSH